MVVEKLRIALLAAHVSGRKGPASMLQNVDQLDIIRFWQIDTLIKAITLESYDLVAIELPCHQRGQAAFLMHQIKALPVAPVVVALTSHVAVADAFELSSRALPYCLLTEDSAPEDIVKQLFSLTQPLPKQPSALAKSAHALFARHYANEDFVVQSPSMVALLDLARQAALGPSTVLITGESGTGKEKLARFVHTHSARAAEPFVAINCAALSSGVLESELYGHVKGAFTGAQHDTPGLFRQASGGTLFLDEIGEIDSAFQAKLLRVLQEREVQPVGSTKRIPFDVRLIAATNKDLRQHTSFRRDLYFRLSVIPLSLPALRDRPEEILLLTQLFIKKMNSRLNRTIQGVEPAVERFLMNYGWPGNVRELENLIERGCALERGTHLSLNALQLDQLPHPSPTLSLNLSQNLDHTSKQCIQRALTRYDGRRADAAQALGIERTTLYRLMKKHDLLDPPKS